MLKQRQTSGRNKRSRNKREKGKPMGSKRKSPVRRSVVKIDGTVPTTNANNADSLGSQNVRATDPHDPGLLPDFDPEKIMTLRKQKTLKRLLWFVTHGSEPERQWAQDLYDRMIKCRIPESPCQELVCPLCMKQFRRGYGRDMSVLFEKEDNLFLVTLVIERRMLTSSDLPNFKPQQIRDMVWQQINRSGLEIVAVGGIEVDFDSQSKMWVPHVHFVCCGATKKELEQFTSRFYHKAEGLQDIVPRPSHIVEIKKDDRLSVFTYTLKNFFWRRVPQEVNNVKRQTKRELQGAQFTLALRVFGQMKPTDMMFVYGARRYSDGFRVPTVPSSIPA